jgi:hypothetical protein
MANIIETLIRKIDVFGVHPAFNFNSESRFRTTKGGILSILFFCLCLAGILHFGQELYLKSSPYVVQSTEFANSPGRYNLTDEFTVMIGIGSTTQFLYVDPTVYSITAKVLIETKHVDINGKEFIANNEIMLRTEKCIPERHFGSFLSQFDEVKNNPGYCIHPDDKDKMFLQGSKGADSYAYLFITVDKCANKTIPGIICQPDSVIETLLGEGFFTLDYIDSIFDPKNFSDPKSNIRRHYFDTVSKKFFKEYFFYFNSLEFQTDDGFLIEDISYINHITFDSISQALSTKNTIGPYYGASFRLNNIKNTIFRKYTKIQDVVADVGGLIKGILIVLEILMYLFSTHDYHNRIINESYVVETKTHHNTKLQIATSFFNKSSAIENNFIKEITTQNINTTRKDLEAKIKNTNFQKSNFSLNFFKSIYFSICAKNNRNYNFFLTATDKFIHNTDIITYNKLVEEYEFIRNVLFDENGRELLHWLKDNRTPHSYQNGYVNNNKLVECYHSLKDDVISKSLRKELLNYFE